MTWLREDSTVSNYIRPPVIRLVTENETVHPPDGFMRIKRSNVVFHYPGGDKSEPTVVDHLYRRGSDAVCILPHYLDKTTGQRMIYLRSAIRPAVYLHNYTTSFIPEEPGVGNSWEAAAGLVEAHESGPEGLRAAAARECREEVGFMSAAQDMKSLGQRSFTAVGMSPERIFFFTTEVDPTTQGEPLEDGGPFEKHGVVICVPLTDALEWVDAGLISDAKTEIGLYRLARSLS